jgi:hypothetical protein
MTDNQAWREDVASKDAENGVLDFFYNFSFESIADQKGFRETNNGIFFLLGIFQQTSKSTHHLALQASILHAVGSHSFSLQSMRFSKTSSVPLKKTKN